MSSYSFAKSGFFKSPDIDSECTLLGFYILDQIPYIQTLSKLGLGSKTNKRNRCRQKKLDKHDMREKYDNTYDSPVLVSSRGLILMAYLNET